MSHEETTDPLAEVQAMGKVAEALAPLSEGAQKRVLEWAISRFNTEVGRRERGERPKSQASVSDSEPMRTGQQFTDLAELYSATNPESEADKALVVAYWLQFIEGRQEFGSQEINSALKNLGHPIGNITTAFDSLKARRPAPVFQMKKAGTTKQARKTFKVTVAGKTAVEMMVGQHAS